MWRDGDDRIMDILDVIESENKESVPAVCPICGEREGHLYFHRYEKGHEAGGMWTWCSACCHSAHCRGRVPEWWINLEEINFEKLTAYPDYLEENKNRIDQWVNRIDKIKTYKMLKDEEMLQLRASYIEIGKLVQEYGYGEYSGILKILMEQVNCIDSNENGREKLQFLIDSYTRWIQGKGGLIDFVRYDKNSEVYNILNEKLGGELEKVWGILKDYL